MDIMEILLIALASIGAIAIVIPTLRIIRNIFLYWRPLDLVDRYGGDSWALITGGSDGIGLGFAQELAKLGFNICIIARN